MVVKVCMDFFFPVLKISHTPDFCLTQVLDVILCESLRRLCHQLNFSFPDKNMKKLLNKNL